MRKDNKWKFFKRIIELSEAKDWESAKKEWKVIKITQIDKEEDYGECICSHYPIKEMIQMFNNLNHHEVIVGNCCINKFFEIKDYNKIFRAVKKGKINALMIDEAYAKSKINQWEFNFISDVWRKRNLSFKQYDKLEDIKLKIINLFTMNSERIKK